MRAGRFIPAAIAGGQHEGETVTAASQRPVVGWMLGGIAVLHVPVTPLLYADSVDSILGAGVLAPIDADPARKDLRSAGFWFAIAGIGLFLVAILLARAELIEGPPAQAVVGLVVLAAWGLAFMPVSGFLAIVATAAVAAYRHRRLTPRAPSPSDE
jgi:Family of unknown function (DUF6463)